MPTLSMSDGPSSIPDGPTWPENTTDAQRRIPDGPGSCPDGPTYIPVVRPPCSSPVPWQPVSVVRLGVQTVWPNVGPSDLEPGRPTSPSL